MKPLCIFSLSTMCLFGCSGQSNDLETSQSSSDIVPDTSIAITKPQVIYPWLGSDHKDENTLIKRVPSPDGYSRIKVQNGSFAEWLRYVPIKEGNPKVMLYNGEEKWNQSAHQVIIDMDVGKRDLQQCADATMRLRAEYLYSKQAFDSIGFNFTNGTPALYKKWRQGYRANISGSRVNWTKKTGADTSYQSFRKYMDLVFTYAGTLSLSRELTALSSPNDLKAGDLFIKGGSPGHAVMVMDIVENTDGKKLFLIAQSYMPAQEMHVLKNPNNYKLSPWYEIEFHEGQLLTPEWTFSKDQLMRFR